MEGEVAVGALVECLVAEQVGGWPGGCGRPFAVPINIGCIIRACPDGVFDDVDEGSNDGVVGNVTAEF